MFQMFGSLVVQKIAVNKFSSSDYFDIINEVRVNIWKTNSTIIHLSNKYFISKEIVSEYSSVLICEIVWISSSYVRKISEECVHWIVLFADIIQVLRIFIDFA